MHDERDMQQQERPHAQADVLEHFFERVVGEQVREYACQHGHQRY
jgi:hypothetical protein